MTQNAPQNITTQPVLSKVVTEQIALQQAQVADVGQRGITVQASSGSQFGSSSLQVGDTVRLLSVPPAQAQDIATNFANSIRISLVNLGANQGLLSAIKNPILSNNLFNFSQAISSLVQAQVSFIANGIQSQSSVLNLSLIHI